ncbi:hypothetical protein ACWDOP_00395 [Nocardia sp. NPDC003693]
MTAEIPPAPWPVDLRVVDLHGDPIGVDPGVPGPAMDELIVSIAPDQVKAMERIGMGTMPTKPIPPADPDFYDPVTDIMPAQVAVAFRDTHGVRGIALHKLTRPSLDMWDCGWWITVPECRAAVRVWERAGCPDLGENTGAVIAFLHLAADHAGARVWASV